MTTTTADKGEQECREAFEKWAITQEWIAPVKNHEPFSRECYPDGDYDITAVRAAWAAWNRRPTNEGQDRLTDSAILTDAHRYCCKYVHADDAPYRFTERGIIEFVRIRIERALNQRLAVKEVGKDFCAVGGECSCRKFHMDPNDCENGINHSDDQQAKDAVRTIYAIVAAAGGMVKVAPGILIAMSNNDRLERYEELDGTIVFRTRSTTKQEEV